MLDIISMITLIILFISFTVIMMLILIGVNMSKSTIEKNHELEEQANFIREYEKNKKNNFRVLLKELFRKEMKNEKKKI